MAVGVKAKIWLEKDGELVFSRGRGELLRMTRDLGSLYRAAKTLSMSYRAAWGKIRATEKKLGWKLVKVEGPRKHFILTPEGEDLLDRYLELEKEAERVLLELYHKRFPSGL
jgi:molybdate transport system regulatory protein